MAEKQKMMFVVTHYDKDPDRTAVPLVLANNALSMGHEVYVWVTMEGVLLAKKDTAGHIPSVSFPAIAELLEAYKEQGGEIGVCPPCAKTHGVTDENLAENAHWCGGACMLEASQKYDITYNF